MVRQLVRAPVKLLITQPLAFKDKGHSVRRHRGLPLEQFVKTEVWEVGPSFVPLADEPVSFRRGQERQLRNPLVRTGDNSFEQGFEVPEHPAGGRGVEAICFVADVQRQLRARHRRDGQGIVRLFDGTKAGDLQTPVPPRK